MTFEELKHRFSFHSAAGDEKKQKAHSAIRQECLALALFINDSVPAGREQSLAFTHLEEVMMWANAGIARNG